MQLPCEIDLKSVSTMLVLDDSLQEKIALSNMLEFKMVSELQPASENGLYYVSEEQNFSGHKCKGNLL